MSLGDREWVTPGKRWPVWSPGGGVPGLALGYFLWYVAFAGLVKALSSGLLPGVDERVGGLVLLPAAALGTLAAAPLFLAVSGWWRYVGHRRIRGRTVRFPARAQLIAGVFMALIMGTTTLSYTFAGVSILFMLLMMRAGTLILAPVVDALRRRRVRPHSWVALGFSMLAIAAALGAVHSYELTLGAVLGLAVHITGYVGRFEIMSRVAKTGDHRVDRRYFAEEHISAAVALVALCALGAMVGAGPAMGALREGFTSFLATPAAIPAFGIGLLYEAIFIFGTLIYLDAREYTWCVPVNRCASVFSVLVASYGLAWLAGIAPPSAPLLAGAGLVVLAALALSYPELRRRVRGAAEPAPRAGAGRPARPLPRGAVPLNVYGIVGGSVRPSLAPRVFNTGYRALGLPAVYVPFSTADFDRFWREVVVTGAPALGGPLRGLTVARPHKEAALALAAASSKRAGSVGAANLLLNDGPGWWADTTSGIVEPLRAVGMEPAGGRAAVVGCGGAGRAVARELGMAGADVVLVNRGADRGEYASRLLRLPWKSLAGFRPNGFDLVVNATPVADEPVFDLASLGEEAVVADLVYRADSDTALVAAVRARGQRAFDGRQVLLAEIGRQFELISGRPLPPAAARIALGNGHAGNGSAAHA